jgi:hypothetical protein
MRYHQKAGLLCLVLTICCTAQTVPSYESEIETSRATEMAQRALQYEMMLGVDINSTLAVCVDERLHDVWMLPEKAETELSAKAVGRVRRGLEICQSSAVGQTKDLRLSAEIRQGMEAQLIAARKLELNRNSARICLGKSQTQDTYKECMAIALPTALSEFQWPKWLMLYERRTSLIALGSVGN